MSFCRDCLADVRRHRRALPGMRLAAACAASRARPAHHRPCRLRRLLRHHRKARRPGARRQAGDRRRRESAAWSRPACYVARTYGIRSAMPMFEALALLPAGGRWSSRTWRNTFQGRPRSAPRMFDLTPLVEPLSIDEAFLDLTGTERLHGMSAAKVLARFAGASRARPRHHGFGRALGQQVPRQDRVRHGQAARLCGARARPRPRRFWRQSRSASSMASAP